MHNSLHGPHDPTHRTDENHSPLVADALGQAYHTIKVHQGGLPGQVAARELILPVTQSPMSARQRMQVYYVQGMAALAEGDYSECVALLTAAGDLARKVPDLLAGAELAYLRGVAEIMRHEYARAREHYAASLDLLITARGDDLSLPSPDPEIEASSILGVAGCDFLAARYTVAQRYTELARSVLAPSPKPITAATLAWLQATLDRWRGLPARALRTALDAAETFAQTSSLGAVGQLLLLGALCSLDLAESPAGSHSKSQPALASASWLAMAQPLIERTLRHARATSDASLEGHAFLAKARYDRLALPPSSDTLALSLVDTIIARAQELDDPVLLCEALTERGRQLAAQSHVEAAATAYQKAIEQAEARGVPAIGTWAQRGLEVLRREHPGGAV